MATSNDNTLKATVRTEFGKGAARRTRRAGLIPAVLYGHGSDPVHLALPSHETFLILKSNANALLTLEVDGENQLALTKDIQRDPVRRTIDHLDLLLVRRGEKVVVDVPVYVIGESAPGTIHQVEAMNLPLRADATQIPEHVEVSVEGLEDGAVVRAGEIALPSGSELEVDPETAVVVISIPRVAEEDLETPAPAEGEVEAEAAAAEEPVAAEEASSEEA